MKTTLILILLAALPTAGLASLQACAEAQRAEYAGKPAVIDCSKQYAPSIASLLATFAVRAAIAGSVDWPAVETSAKGAGLGVGSCALAEFLRAWKRQPAAEVAARTLGPDDLAQLEGVLARVSGGAEVRLADAP